MKIDKNDVIEAIKDMNEFMDFKNPISINQNLDIDELKNEINKKVNSNISSEQFLDEDFDIMDEDTLKPKTVQTLISLNVKVPKEWKERLKECSLEVEEQFEEIEEQIKEAEEVEEEKQIKKVEKEQKTKSISQASIINDCLDKKMDIEEIAIELAEKTNKDKKWAKNRVYVHLSWLNKKK